MVQGGEGALHGAFFDDEGDVVFAGALSDGHDVHIFAADGGLQPTGDTGTPPILVACGNSSQIINLFGVHFVAECCIRETASSGGIL